MMKVRKLFLPIRAFSTKRDKKFSEKNVKNVQSYQVLKPVDSNPNPGIGNRLKMYEEDELSAEISASHEFEDLHEDMDEFEADFMNAGKSHWMHEKEIRQRKEKLKTKITYSKYLSEVEPSFLTFAEKEEIKSLHERDPHEWSVEKLSESFPALPATIKKILNAKWSPKSVETVMKYDEKVINNWEAYREGELPLSPMMKKHLENFKDRRIVPTDPELAKQYVLPKIEFPKPKSTMFSKIAQTFLIQDKENKINTDDTNTAKEVNLNVVNKSKNRVFESNKDFNVSKNVKGKNKHWDIQENEDYDEEIYESEINHQEKKALFVSNRIWNTDMNFETIKNSDFKNRSLETNGNSSYKERNFEENEDTNNVRSLTIQEGYKNTKVLPASEKNQMTVLSQNLEVNDREESKKFLTFDEFLVKNVGRTKDSSSPEDIVLRETYKRHIESISSDSKPARFREPETEEEDFNSESKFESKEPAIERNISSVSLTEKEEGKGTESRISTRRTRENEISNFNKSQTDLISKQNENELSFSIQRSAIDTYVKEWIKKGDDIDDDPSFINIPKNRYKEGMTYRVKNCYYDDDGEFLYKVPGLHN